MSSKTWIISSASWIIWLRSGRWKRGRSRWNRRGHISRLCSWKIWIRSKIVIPPVLGGVVIPITVIGVVSVIVKVIPPVVVGGIIGAPPIVVVGTKISSV